MTAFLHIFKYVREKMLTDGYILKSSLSAPTVKRLLEVAENVVHKQINKYTHNEPSIHSGLLQLVHYKLLTITFVSN